MFTWDKKEPKFRIEDEKKSDEEGKKFDGHDPEGHGRSPTREKDIRLSPPFKWLRRKDWKELQRKPQRFRTIEGMHCDLMIYSTKWKYSSRLAENFRGVVMRFFHFVLFNMFLWIKELSWVKMLGDDCLYSKGHRTEYLTVFLTHSFLDRAIIVSRRFCQGVSC